MLRFSESPRRVGYIRAITGTVPWKDPGNYHNDSVQNGVPFIRLFSMLFQTRADTEDPWLFGLCGDLAARDEHAAWQQPGPRQAEVRRVLDHAARDVSQLAQELRAPGLVDAGAFFQPWQLTATGQPQPWIDDLYPATFAWDSLRILSLTTTYAVTALGPEGDVVGDLATVLAAAGRAALQMPSLEAMEIWQLARVEVMHLHDVFPGAVFHYHREVQFPEFTGLEARVGQSQVTYNANFPQTRDDNRLLAAVRPVWQRVAESHVATSGDFNTIEIPMEATDAERAVQHLFPLSPICTYNGYFRLALP